jgi:hypothetical protein
MSDFDHLGPGRHAGHSSAESPGKTAGRQRLYRWWTWFKLCLGASWILSFLDYDASVIL